MAFVFKEFTTDCYEDVATRLESSAYGRCEYTFGTLLMYSKILNIKYCIDNDVLFLQAEGRNKRFYFAPVANTDEDFLCGVEKLVAYEKQNGNSTIISNIPVDKSKLIANPSQRMEGCPDYVYDIVAFRDLKGKKYHGKRNHIARFDKEISEYSFDKITSKNLPLILEFYEKFKQNESKESEIFKVELQATQMLLDNYESSRFEGYYLSTKGNVLGFTIAEKQGEFLVVHVEKCDKNFHGVYEKIANEFTKKMMEIYPDLKYLNREDDAGDEGLRKAKLSYKPLYMAEKEKLIFD